MNEHLHNSMIATDKLDALAGEDRAALSGRPRKANAGQYEGVMPQRNPVRTRDTNATPDFDN